MKDKAKEGEVPTRYGAEGEKVDSSVLIHHITNIESSVPRDNDDTIDEEAVELMRFDFRG